MRKIIFKSIIITSLIFLFVLTNSCYATNNYTNEIDEGIYYIETALNTNKVFDVESNSKINSAKIQLWEKSAQSTDNQKFEFISNGDGYYTIKAKHSGKVLDVVSAGKTNGTKVQQYELNGTDAQSWKIESTGDGYHYIISKCNGLYLDIEGANATNGTKLQVYTGNKTSAQKFKLETIEKKEKLISEKTIDDGTYKIKTYKNNSIGLDIASASRNNGANLQIWKASEIVSKNQMFDITFKSDGYYEILAHHSGKSLDVAGGGTQNGCNVQQYESNNTDAQKWIIKKNADGSYSILSKASGLCLDITKGNIANGSNVQIYESNGSDAQKFIFEKVNKATCNKVIEDGVYKISSGLNSNKYIDIASGSYSNCANAQIWDSGDVQQQKFEITYKEEGCYEIKCVHSGKVLDIAGGSNANGANVQQYESNNTEYQKWILQDAGNGYYYILSKGAELYLDVAGASNSNGANIQVYDGKQSSSQKFKFIKTQIIENNTYEIKTLNNSNMNLDVDQTSSNTQIWECDHSNNNQKFEVKYIENGNYKIICKSSGKALTVNSNNNVIQAEYNDSNNQKWKVETGKNGYYYIKSILTGLYLDVAGGGTTNGANIQTYKKNSTNSQLFMFYKQTNNSNYSNINTSKYPGYKELLDKLQNAHPNWSIKLLYTGLNFNNAVYGEYSIHNANLIPASSGSEWICSVCGTKLYDTGWYGASDKAIAYYMDPRNFLNDSNVFQFLDANKYEPTSVSLEGIQVNVNGTFLQNYANDINTACKNQGVNPYYVISRLIQENGKNGSTTSKGMDGGNGKTYYNPFNIGATGNGTSQVIANALAKAKTNGWDTMEKALEGGIVFLKANWLDNYQNTLYQNRFDIDSTNGTSLYSHQYMQNLSAAYSEGNLLRGYYSNANKIDSNLTFIIPVYEGMSSTLSQKPSEGTSSEEYPMNVVVNTDGSTLALRSGANTSSTVITRYAKGTVVLSVQRGINSTWQHVVTKDGKVGYMSGEYLKQVSDEKTCNYKAHIKTQSSGGLNVRTGPSTTEGFGKVDYLPDYTQVTVIDDSTYKGYEGSDWVQWSRIILSDGRQAFVPSSYVVKN